MRLRHWLTSLRSGQVGLVFGSLVLFASAPASAAPATPTKLARAPFACEANVQHPIQVRVEALDPIQRGATVRFRLTSQSRVPMIGTEARLVSAGGASVVGKTRADLGRMTPGRDERVDFAVRVPAEGHRFLVEFRVEGEGPAGRIGRGAAFNLLPDGPAVTPRIVADADGRTIAESPARRMP